MEREDNLSQKRGSMEMDSVMDMEMDHQRGQAPHGQSMAPPPFQLAASTQQPIQMMRINFGPNQYVNSRDFTLQELQDKAMYYQMQGRMDVVQQIQQAITAGEYQQVSESGLPMWGQHSAMEGMNQDSPLTIHDLSDSILDDEDGPDYTEQDMKEENLRHLQPGWDWAEQEFKRRKKPHNLNKVQGEMLELQFDSQMEESGVPSISTNKFVHNSPGLDHITDYGDQCFEQSKCYLSGSPVDIAKTYGKTYDDRHNQLSLLMNKGLQEGKTGGDIRGMLEDEETQGVSSKVGRYSRRLNRAYEHNQDPMGRENEEYDPTHPTIEMMARRYFMQVPDDIWPILIQQGYDPNVFLSNGLTIEQLRMFQDAVVRIGYANKPSSYRNQPNKDDEEYDPNQGY